MSALGAQHRAGRCTAPAAAAVAVVAAVVVLRALIINLCCIGATGVHGSSSPVVWFWPSLASGSGYAHVLPKPRFRQLCRGTHQPHRDTQGTAEAAGRVWVQRRDIPGKEGLRYTESCRRGRQRRLGGQRGPLLSAPGR